MSRRKEINYHGIWAPNSRHPRVRKIRRLYEPHLYGNRIWPTSWLLIDYLHHRGLPRGKRVLEVGCGWGLPGIYCGKAFGAELISMDDDPEVFPFLWLLAEVNDVKTETLTLDIEGLRAEHFQGIDIIIGSDICFWYSMIEAIIRFIRIAADNGGPLIVLADPGRPTFNDVGDYCEKEEIGRQFYWRSEKPYRLQGQIIEVWGNNKASPVLEPPIRKTGPTCSRDLAGVCS